MASDWFRHRALRACGRLEVPFWGCTQQGPQRHSIANLPKRTTAMWRFDMSRPATVSKCPVRARIQGALKKFISTIGCALRMLFSVLAPLPQRSLRSLGWGGVGPFGYRNFFGNCSGPQPSQARQRKRPRPAPLSSSQGPHNDAKSSPPANRGQKDQINRRILQTMISGIPLVLGIGPRM